MAKKHHTHELELVCDWKNGTFSPLPVYLLHLVEGKGEQEAKGTIADKYGCELLIACRGCLKDLVEVDFGCPETSEPSTTALFMKLSIGWLTS